MNCQDIARTLESRDVNGLSATERRACEAHALHCPHCGPEWIVYTRLAAIAVPPMPAEFAAQCESLVAAQKNVSSIRRAPGRVVLGVAIFALAAAAALLAIHRTGRPPTASAALAAATVASPVEAPTTESPAPASTEPTEHAEPTAREEKAELEEAVTPFTVRVLPLQNEAKSAANVAAFTLMYTAFLDRLRAIPGATLLETESSGTGSPAQVDYQIKITGKETPDNRLIGEIQTDFALRRIFTSFTMNIAPGCVNTLVLSIHDLESDSSRCQGPETVAANQASTLRKIAFPPDPSLRRQFQARLLDLSLDAQQRLQALHDLDSLGRANSSMNAIAAPPTLRDPVVLRAAVDLATTSADPTVRASVWNTLHGTGDAKLIPPLLAALGRDPDGEVRLAALGVLSGEFGADPRVQAALNTATRDPRPLVRALAQRATNSVAGEVEWRKYIAASLKDSNRPAAERIEALFFQLNLSISPSLWSRADSDMPGTLDKLDDDAIKALAETLPMAAADSSFIQRSANQLVANLGNVERPAVTDMLLAIIGSGDTSVSRAGITEALGKPEGRRNEPRVHAVLEKLSTDDPDPQVRQLAATALSTADVPPSTSPRLGTIIAAVESGAGIPTELVGKARVMRVGSGSVAENAGVRQGDVLLEINGTPIPSDLNVLKMLATMPRGVDVDLLVSRSGETLRLTARF